MHPSVPSRYPGDGALASSQPADLAGQADLSALFQRRHAELVRLARLLVGDQPTAEDVVQDVFARLHTRRLRGSPAGDSLAYVRAAVLNGCRSHLRRRAVAQRFLGSQAKQAGQAAHASAEQELMRAEERKQIIEALSALPARRREVLVLRYYLGLSEAEIARVLGISTGTVKSTAARGLAALAKRLGEEA
ncbi:MAG TPA: SigE family RNA polymerase sigma factor [Streptosporangiaceae bacterium]